MKSRVRILKPEPVKATSGGRYFEIAAAHKSILRIKTGCPLLDCALSGGWGKGRVINIVGDKSTGKTLLATELCANFALQYGPKVQIRYRDCEAAFDVAYAQIVGLPPDVVDFGDGGELETVQDFERDLREFCAGLPKNVPGVYVLDSLDALSDDVEMSRTGNEEKGTYGLGKAKLMSQLFRKMIREIKRKDVTLVVVSQLRDAIGVMFGEKHTRTGGRALDFYSSQIVWLAQKGAISKTRKGIEREVGINVRAKVKKSKCGPAFREVDFPIYFNYGVDDVRAGLAFLAQVKRLDGLGLAELNAKEDTEEEAAKSSRYKKPKGNVGLTKFMDKLDGMDPTEYLSFRRRLNKMVRAVWAEIEEDFSPPRRKYDNG